MRRFELDADAERAVGWLRLVGAALVVAMGTVLVADGAGPVGWVLVVSAWLVALGWTVAFLRSRRRAQDADAHYLELGPESLRMARGGEPLEVPWRDVRGIEVDEERLVVWVRRGAGPPVKIEPVWRGVGLHELADHLEDAAQGRSA